jgi:hypothetical protein
MWESRGILVLNTSGCFRIPFNTNSKVFDLQADAISSLPMRPIGDVIMVVNSGRRSLTTAALKQHTRLELIA